MIVSELLGKLIPLENVQVFFEADAGLAEVKSIHLDQLSGYPIVVLSEYEENPK